MAGLTKKEELSIIYKTIVASKTFNEISTKIVNPKKLKGEK
jgi:hypothetical protein